MPTKPFGGTGGLEPLTISKLDEDNLIDPLLHMGQETLVGYDITNSSKSYYQTKIN